MPVLKYASIETCYKIKTKMAKIRLEQKWNIIIRTNLTQKSATVSIWTYTLFIYQLRGNKMVHEKKKPMVQVHKRETLLHNKNRITHLKKKLYKKLHTITFLYICLCTYACTFLNIIHHNGSTESCCNVCWKIFT